MKAKKWACIATAAVMTASLAAIFAGCGEDQVTVTWYNGRNVLKTDKVDSGATVKEWTPERDGYIFTGWYEEASLSTEFDFSTKIEEDTQIYSAWRSATVEADTRIWYAIGTGAETMKASNWKFATEAATDENGPILDENGFATFTEKEGFGDLIFDKAEDSNVFTLNLKLRAGDKFRFITNAINDDWTGDAGKAEVGLGSMPGFEYAAGINPEKSSEVTLESKEYGVVKIDGEVVFEGGKEFNTDPKGWNIFVKEGHDGEYKFTLTTYPGEDTNNTLAVEWVGDLPELTETHKMYLVGTHAAGNKEWNVDDKTYKNDWYMKKENDGTFRTFVEIKNDMFPSWGDGAHAYVKVKNEIDNKDYGVDGGMENIALTEGTWCITYNPDGNKVKFEKCDYYLVGTIRIGDKNYNFESFDPSIQPKLTTNDNGATYTITYKVDDMSNVDGYKWLKDKEMKDTKAKPVAAFKVIFGSSIGVKTWFDAEDSGVEGETNYYAAEAGNYTFTLTTSDNKFVVTKN